MTIMEQLTIGSLFSGIGGLELGLEWAGLGPVVWQVENDSFCRSVLSRHWPEAKRYKDVREVGEELEPVDLICGGFPCQPFSIASRGRRVAKDLWPEMLRIVRIIRPRFVVAENVGRDPIIKSCRDLWKEGYTPYPIEISASMVGAPHDRPRWFVVADANSKSESRFSINAEMASISDLSGVDWWQNEPEPVGMDDGTPPRLDRLRALGNAVVPQVAEVIGRVVLALHEETRP
jgi:DNA (cytosine-5)-methyltransferase 1